MLNYVLSFPSSTSLLSSHLVKDCEHQPADLSPPWTSHFQSSCCSFFLCSNAQVQRGTLRRCRGKWKTKICERENWRHRKIGQTFSLFLRMSRTKSAWRWSPGDKHSARAIVCAHSETFDFQPACGENSLQTFHAANKKILKEKIVTFLFLAFPISCALAIHLQEENGWWETGFWRGLIMRSLKRGEGSMNDSNVSLNLKPGVCCKHNSHCWCLWRFSRISPDNGKTESATLWWTIYNIIILFSFQRGSSRSAFSEFYLQPSNITWLRARYLIINKSAILSVDEMTWIIFSPGVHVLIFVRDPFYRLDPSKLVQILVQSWMQNFL